GLDDLLRGLIAGREIGVGHARQRRMAEALPAARSGRSLPGEAGIEMIVEIALENAFLDQHLALAGISFVVDVDRSAAARDGSVVDHSHQLAGHFLAQLSRAERRALAAEVRFTPVPYRPLPETSA